MAGHVSVDAGGVLKDAAHDVEACENGDAPLEGPLYMRAVYVVKDAHEDITRGAGESCARWRERGRNLAADLKRRRYPPVLYARRVKIREGKTL